MYAALFHEPATEGDTFRRIMVPAQHERAHLPRGKFHQKIVKHRDRLGRRHRLVVNVARDQHRIGLFALHSLQNARQYIPLLAEHRMLAHNFTNVQVGRVDKFHRNKSLLQVERRAHIPGKMAVVRVHERHDYARTHLPVLGDAVAGL